MDIKQIAEHVKQCVSLYSDKAVVQYKQDETNGYRIEIIIPADVENPFDLKTV